MKKILRFTLLFIFTLIVANHLWQNLEFNNQEITIFKVALILALFEIIIKPILKILLLPINLLTLGLFRIVINTLGLYMAAFFLSDFYLNNIYLPAHNWLGISIPQLSFSGFWAFAIVSTTSSIILYLFNSILTKKG